MIGRPAQVESLLSATVVGWEPVPPWSVARARLGAGGSVIAKWTRPHVIQGWDAGRRTRTEVAALRFLADDLDLDLAPRVLAADLDGGLVVLEDLSPRTPLDGLLRTDGSAPHAGRLAAFGRARGTLNAATAGRAATYYARLSALGPVSPAEDRAGHFAGHHERGLRAADAFGAPVTGRAAGELAAAVAELREPGPFLALSNSDPESNNVLVHAAGEPDARLIDFEFAGYTHCLHDAVCLHVPGPGWLSVADPGPADAYRRALATGVPEAEDDRRYGFGLAAACLWYALVRVERLPALDARPPGDDSRAQLVATLEAAAGVANGVLPHLAGWAGRTAELLRRRWPDADREFGGLPPYTPRRR
ncbi:hypothetical protein AB0L44_12950 [Nonomuraea wenchangensis]|uniref:hypothetical protein n=1 Tax=Nonomuraea wenchangensis TaxID=568860 RepID=UPI003444574F